LKNNKIIQTLEFPKSEEIIFDIDPKQQFLYVVEQSAFSNIYKYSKYNMKRISKLTIDSDCASVVKCSNDGEMVYIGDLEGRLITYNVKDNERFGEVFVEFKIMSMALSHNKQLLMLGGSEGHVAAFSEKRYIIVKTFNNFSMEDIVSMAITSDDKYLFISDIWCNMKMLSMTNMKILKEYVGLHEDSINSIGLTPNDNF